MGKLTFALTSVLEPPAEQVLNQNQEVGYR